jgi:hypothetical protein
MPPSPNRATEASRWQEPREWVRFVIEVLTLAAVIWYAWVAQGQLTQMIQATNTATEANQLSKRQQRAWLYPTIQEAPRPIEKLGDLTIVSVTVQNTGKSLATDVKFRAWMNVFDKLPDSLPTTPPLRQTVVPPNASVQIFFGTVPPVIRRRLDDLNDEHRPTLIVWADLTYTDEFNTAGQAYFCRKYDAIPKRFITCPENRSWGPDLAT